MTLCTYPAGRAAGGVGFLSDVRRLNVAITRAKRALWILGAAATLRADPVWEALIECVTAVQRTEP